MVENVCATVSNYATEALQETLNFYGKEGFSLVSTQMASDKYGSQVMYLFFVRNTGTNCIRRKKNDYGLQQQRVPISDFVC